jgi:hypothetical protein
MTVGDLPRIARRMRVLAIMKRVLFARASRKALSVIFPRRMVRLLLILVGYAATSVLAVAQVRAPLAECLKDAQVVCIARAISLKNGTYTFTVTENLRGMAPKVITGKGFVQVPDDNSEFPANSEWVLMSHGKMEKWGKEITIGGDEEDWGYGNWGPARIVHLQSKTYVAWHYHLPGDPITFDKDLGGGEFALSEEHFQTLILKYPYQP